MWQKPFLQEREPSEFLDQVVRRIEVDPHLFKHAESILDAVSHQEPLIAQSLKTPQDVRYHAEGPFMRDHLRLMLMFLYALAEGKIHLLDIEEFRRMKGYEGDIQELEELMKENVALFQVFTLCHDSAKWLTATFSAQPGSRGEALGFRSSRLHHVDEGAVERAQQMRTYLALYDTFTKTEFHGTDRETQAQFYLHYGINVHYPHHARKIHVPVLEALLKRMCQAYRLPDHDWSLLEDLIVHHLECGSDFKHPRPERVRRYVHLATKRGYDADRYIDLVQGGLLLDQVVGSLRLGPHGYWHESASLLNFLRSEHDFAPHRRWEKSAVREVEEKKARNRWFQETGLDGIALMELLDMEPGPEFGMMLRRIHAAILGQGEMPKFGERVDTQIQERATEYYKKQFGTGG